MRDIIDLLFLNLNQNEGLNLTVRNTDRWFQRTHRFRYGRPVRLFEVSAKPKSERKFGLGEFVCSAVMPFSVIPQEFLDFEHDPKCRKRKGLRKTMKNIYGEAFNEDGPVSLIFYWVPKECEDCGASMLWEEKGWVCLVCRDGIESFGEEEPNEDGRGDSEATQEPDS